MRILLLCVILLFTGCVYDSLADDYYHQIIELQREKHYGGGGMGNPYGGDLFGGDLPGWSSPYGTVGDGSWDAPLPAFDASSPASPDNPYPGWTTGGTQVPGIKQQAYGTVPSYFANLPQSMGAISPLGMAALMRLFGNVGYANAPMKEYTQTPGAPAQAATPTAPSVPATEPVMAETGWATPSPASAQDYRKMQAGGAWPALQSFMQLAGETVMQQFLQQMQSMWAPQQKQEAPQWQVPKQR